VAHYRLYSLEDGGHLGLPEEVVADSDCEAISKARELKPDALQCEIWKGHRLVTSFRGQDLAG
jgi:hypothetical protein